MSCVLVDYFSVPSGVSNLLSTPNTRSARRMMRTSQEQSLFIRQHRASAFTSPPPCSSCVVIDVGTLCRALHRRSSVSSDRLPPSRSLHPSSGLYPSLPLTLPTLLSLLHLSVGLWGASPRAMPMLSWLEDPSCRRMQMRSRMNWIRDLGSTLLTKLFLRARSRVVESAKWALSKPSANGNCDNYLDYVSRGFWCISFLVFV